MGLVLRVGFVVGLNFCFVGWLGCVRLWCCCFWGGLILIVGLVLFGLVYDCWAYCVFGCLMFLFVYGWFCLVRWVGVFWFRVWCFGGLVFGVWVVCLSWGWGWVGVGFGGWVLLWCCVMVGIASEYFYL